MPYRRRSRHRSRDQGHDTISQPLDRAENESLVHAHPLYPAHEAPEPHRFDEACKFGGTFLGPSDHHSSTEQFRQIELPFIATDDLGKQSPLPEDR